MQKIKKTSKKRQKLFICLIILFGLGTASMQSQSKSVDFKKFQIGVNLGLNLSNIEKPKRFDASLKAGINVGVSVTYRFSNLFGLKIKGIYDNKGFGGLSFPNSNGIGNTNGNINLNYLTVPLLSSFYFGDTTQFNLSAGPFVGFLLSANETAFGNDIKSGFEKSIFGASLGLGVISPINDKLSFVIEYEGQYAFSQANLKSNPPTLKLIRHAINFGILIDLPN